MWGDRSFKKGCKFQGYDILDFTKLNEYRISVVIIAAYDYEDEVYSQIRRIDQKNCKIIRFKEK